MHRIGRLLLLQKSIQRPRVRCRRQHRPMPPHQLHNPRPPLRRSHHPANARTLRRTQRLRHRLVRSNHQLFNQIGRTIVKHSPNRLHLPIHHNRIGLRPAKLQRPLPHPLRPQRHRRLILQLQLRPQSIGNSNLRIRPRRPLQPRPHVAVRKLRLVPHHGPVDTRPPHHPLGVHHKLNHMRRAIFLLIQRSHIRRQLRRQHRKIPHRRIHRLRLIRCMPIDHRVLPHRSRNIRDPHPHANAAIHPLRHLNLIQIPRRIVVDRRPQQRTHILRTLVGRSAQRRANLRHLRLGAVRKIRMETLSDHLRRGRSNKVKCSGRHAREAYHAAALLRRLLQCSDKQPGPP